MESNVKDLLLHWWYTSNDEVCTEEENKVFLKALESDEEKLLHLVMQGDLFGNGKNYILTAIHQGALDYLLKELPEIDEKNTDYQYLRAQYITKLRTDSSYLKEDELPISINDMDWNQIIEDIKAVEKERRERK